MQAIQQLQTKPGASPVMHSPPMDVFQRLAAELDTEGRYLFLNALANQLRYPNNHTHYFSCVLLYLFAEANQARRPALLSALSLSVASVTNQSAISFTSLAQGLCLVSRQRTSLNHQPHGHA